MTQREAPAKTLTAQAGQGAWRTPDSINSLFEDLPQHRAGVSHPVTRAMLMRWNGESYARLDVPDKHHGSEGLSRLLLAIRENRSDLRAAFDISTAEGRSKLVCWYLQSGRKELEIGWDAPEWQRYTLAELDPRFPEDPALPISRLMAHLWFGRPDLQQKFPLDVRVQRGRFIAWFYFVWFDEQDFGSFMLPQQLAWLFKNLPGTRLRRDAWLLWRYLPNLNSTFPLTSAADVVKYVNWFGVHGNSTLRNIQSRKKSLQRKAAPSHCFAPARGCGVNLIGDAFGEEVRTAAACLENVGIPFSIFNFAPGINVSQQDTSPPGRVSDEVPYDINLFCISGMEMVRVFLLHGRSLFDGRYNIGWWPWDFPVWPKAWADAYALVDEIWAASQYTGDAYRKSAPVPVRQVPLAITLEALNADVSSDFGRPHFGLPENTYLFYLSFDFDSTIERKNPWASLRAFRAAFPGKRKDVGLVIKVMHTSPGDPTWRQLQAEVAADKRITLIDQPLRRDELLVLYAACDCYVSLHRAEGFGRGVAEAMLLGKSVIVSDYSGTRDFAYGPLVHPVKGRLVPIKVGDYPGASGKERWFDADIEQAAQRMVSLASRQGGSASAQQASGCERLTLDFVSGEIAKALESARKQRDCADMDNTERLA
ncbi:MAG: glycosyltransferase [Pseudomonadota bacterium]